MIRVFDHPWVQGFEKKYNLNKVTPPPKNKDSDKIKAQKALEAKALAEAAEK